MIPGQLNRAQKGTGFGDYNDSGTTQIVVANVWTPLTDDATGVLTDVEHLPLGVNQLWDAITNTIDLSGLQIGDVVRVRIDLVITPSVNNSSFHIRLWFLSFGGWAMEKRQARMDEGAGVAYNWVEEFGFHVGSDDVRLGGARVEVLCGSDSSITLNGICVLLT